MASIGISSRAIKSVAIGCLAVLLAAACGLYGASLQTPKSQPQIVHQRFTSGGFAPVRLDDTVTVTSSCAGLVQIRSGSTTVARLQTGLKPASWLSLGDDQYQFLIHPDCAMDVAVSHRDPLVSPLLTALFLAIAALLAVFAACAFFSGISFSPGPITDKFSVRVALPSFLISLAVFLAVPSYYHNDAVGGNFVRNWGYRGWGYFDTAREVAWRFAHEGLAGLPHMQTFGKPLAMPVFSLLTGFGISPYVSGPLQSAVLSALSAAGIGVLAFWATGRRRAAAVAVAIFALNPIALAYSTSFYEECGWIAGVVWACVFAHLAIQRRSNGFVIASVVCAAFAVSAKQLLVIPLTEAVLAATLLYLGARGRNVIVYVAGSTIAVAAMSIAAWPFLWQDTAFRLPFILGARMTFDTVHGLSSPLYVRASHALWVQFARTTPAQIVLALLAIALWIKQQRLRSLWLALAIAASIGFTIPTSFFLQHYILYSLPFIALLCGDAAAQLTLRNGYAVAGVTFLLQGAWSGIFFPYTGTASILCPSVRCSLDRAGVAEPVYGLREAAQWFQKNGRGDERVVTLAAPHVLQAYLPQMQVLFAPSLPASAMDQEDLLDSLHARYVVITAWYEAGGYAFVAPNFKLEYQTPDREGGVRVFSRTDNQTGTTVRPDLSQSDLDSVDGGSPRRILFAAAGANVRTTHWMQNLIETAPLPGYVAPTVSNVGTGLVIVPENSPLDRGLRQKHRITGKIRGVYDVYDMR